VPLSRNPTVGLGPGAGQPGTPGYRLTIVIEPEKLVTSTIALPFP
jgi:hypothetical protein